MADEARDIVDWGHFEKSRSELGPGFIAPPDPSLPLWSHTVPGEVEPRCRNKTVRAAGWESHKGCFANLWEKINGAENWDQNRWVWALSFNVYQQNIDAFLQSREAA